jgi:hypothetical protein
LEYLKKLLSESGDASTVRVMSVLSLLVGIGIGLYGVWKGVDFSGIAQVCSVFVGAAFAAKTVSKFAERD